LFAFKVQDGCGKTSVRQSLAAELRIKIAKAEAAGNDSDYE
jgi:hypothetical protein